MATGFTGPITNSPGVLICVKLRQKIINLRKIWREEEACSSCNAKDRPEFIFLCG